MTAVPAQVAGVRRIAVMTPRAGRSDLVVARELGIDEIYEVGGAQGVAALAYGTESIACGGQDRRPGQRLRHGRQAAGLEPGRDRPACRPERGRRDRRRECGGRRSCAADLLAQAEHGPDSEAILFTDDPVLSAAVSTLVGGYDNIVVELVDSLDDALSRSRRTRRSISSCSSPSPRQLLGRVRNAGTVFVGTSAVVGDYAAGATHVLPTGGLARASGGLGLESFLKPLQIVRASAAGIAAAQAIVGPLARVEGLPLHAAALDVRVAEASRERATPPEQAVAVEEAVQRDRRAGGFTPYVWAPRRELAARHGLRPEQIVRFDQNTPPFAGVPQIPLARELRAPERVPRRDVPGAPRGRSGVRRRRRRAGSRSSSAPAPTSSIYLCARTFLGAGPAGRDLEARPTSSTRRRRCSRGRRAARTTDGADLIWRCNPNNPTGAAVPARELVALAAAQPGVPVVVDEAYVEFGGESVVPFIAEAPNLIVLRTMSKAFGFAALRVGYAVAAPEVAALLEERREPAPIAGPCRQNRRRRPA